MESISKLRATLSDFSPANLFPLAPSLRKIHPPLVPLRSLSLHFFPLSSTFHLPYFLSFYRPLACVLSSLSLPKVACSSRILIPSKVLFPLNRAATTNNALYVRVFRLVSFLIVALSLPFLRLPILFLSNLFSVFSLRSRSCLETSAIFQLSISGQALRRDDFSFLCISKEKQKTFIHRL